MQSFNNYINPEEIGFDAAIEFQPDFSAFPDAVNNNKERKGFLSMSDFFKKSNQKTLNNDRVFLYDEVVDKMLSKPKPSYKLFPGIFPMWDNSPRRDNGATIIYNSTPEKYGRWLAKKILEKFEPYSKDENFIFINAWNEWAEGNHLEPCSKFEKAYLEATKKSIR